ncbi:MAG: beta-mannosidase [Bacteroidales bacterium]|jgi:mannan endo-1,4-beta-mannosidase|nr:beta-mannosidase [Bacteroidales bacterium]
MMKRKLGILLMLALLSPVLLMACGDDEKTETDVVPTFVSSQPADGATDIDINTTQIILTYSDEVNFKTTLNADFNGTACGFSAFARDGKTLTFSIPEPLKKGKTYKLTIPEGFFVSKNGGAAVAEHSVTFSTIAAAEPTITATLVNGNAQAQKVYDYLASQYGQKTISGAMANVSTQVNEANLVYNAVGKYPAIYTIDLIHLQYSWGKSNYDNINTYQTHWQNRGLVAASWHMMVPSSEANASTQDDWSYNTHGFSAKNAIADGTWENAFFKAMLDDGATYLLKYKEAGIPVIFRPLHEASGNYLNGGGDAWFWWGYDGPETYVALWKYMFNYYKDKGLDNLIWVWTAGIDNDITKCDEVWYPGDEYVDIISVDIYNRTYAQCAKMYELLSECWAHKIVTLSECGSVGNISEQLNAGAKWSFFMPWYTYNLTKLEDSEHANTAWWTDAANCANILWRDDLPQW